VSTTLLGLGYFHFFQFSGEGSRAHKSILPQRVFVLSRIIGVANFFSGPSLWPRPLASATIGNEKAKIESVAEREPAVEKRTPGRASSSHLTRRENDERLAAASTRPERFHVEEEVRPGGGRPMALAENLFGRRFFVRPVRKPRPQRPALIQLCLEHVLCAVGCLLTQFVNQEKSAIMSK